MGSKKKLNKAFGRCKKGYLKIDPNTGIAYCYLKETSNSRKYDQNICSNFDCPEFELKIKPLTEKQQIFKKFYEKGKEAKLSDKELKKFVMDNVPCKKTYYHDLRKRFDEEKVLENISIYQISDDEYKDTSIEEIAENPPIDPPNTPIEPLNFSPTIGGTKALNRKIIPKWEEQQKGILKAPKIRLYLSDFHTFQDAMKHGFRHSYNWTKFNIKEMKERIEQQKKVYSLPPFLNVFGERIEATIHRRSPYFNKTSYYSALADKLYKAMKSRALFQLEKISSILSNEVLNLNNKDYKKIRETISKIKREFHPNPNCLDSLENKMEIYPPPKQKTTNGKSSDLILQTYEAIRSKDPIEIEKIANIISNELVNLKIEEFNEIREYTTKLKRELNPLPECLEKLNRRIESYEKFIMSPLPPKDSRGSILGKELYEAVRHRDFFTARKMVFKISNALMYFKLKELHELKEYLSKIQREIDYQPKVIIHIEEYLELWQKARTKELYKENITPRDIYKKYGILLPDKLEPVKNHIIENIWELERIGIFEAKELRIKEELKILDELEYAYHNWDKLNKLDKGHIEIVLQRNKNLKTHPYYVLLMELIKYDKERLINNFW